MPTDEEKRKMLEDFIRSKGEDPKHIAWIAQQAAKDREDVAKLDEELRKFQEGNGK